MVSGGKNRFVSHMPASKAAVSTDISEKAPAAAGHGPCARVRRAAAFILLFVLLVTAAARPAVASVSAEGAPLKNAIGIDVSGFSTVDVHGEPVGGAVLHEHSLTVLHYFATWSPECIAELDYMQEAAASYSDSGLLVLGLLYTDSVSTPESCVGLFESEGLTYNCILPDGVLSQLTSQYPMIPQTFFINSSGVVIDHFPGRFESFEQFEEIITATLGQPAVYHTVRFVDGMTGRLISRQSVLHGSDAIPPRPFEHDGYVFKGWDGSYTNVTEDRLITAIYTLDPDFYQMGDVNMNGVIEISDAVLTLRYAMGIFISDGVRLYGDMNGDGSITVSDAVFILRLAMGIGE